VVTNWDQYPAHLEAIETVEVRCRVPGYIESIHFVDGAEVKAGDLLFVIDPRTYQADLDHAVAQRQQAESHLELTRNDLHRAESLRGTKAISEEDYDNRSKTAREAEGALAAAKASEDMARINLEYTQVRAPINGRIGRRLVTVGNFVQLQSNNGAATLLATLVSQDPIYCYFDADEPAYLQYRQSGMAGREIPCELALVNETGFPHRGTVDFYDNQINQRTGTMRMRAVFDNADRSLVPGMFANVRVPAGPPCQALLVPDVAIGSDQGRRFVYVVNADNVIETRTVKLDRAHGALRAVLEGLHPQDRVVTNGFALVRDKMRVQVQ
jgi:RND family efflux transporter MFP subunit